VLLLLDLLFIILLQLACSIAAANGGWFDPCAAVVPTITSTVTKRIWMDRNLGVDQGLTSIRSHQKQILDSIGTSGVA
jgi:hypothetical protein